MPNRVSIVDDHQVVRMGVRLLLSKYPRWEIFGEAEDGAHALQEVAKEVPDVVILDLSLLVMNGFEVAMEIRRIAPATKIIFFSAHEIPVTTRLVGADAQSNLDRCLRGISEPLWKIPLVRCQRLRRNI